jgi:hypothetical protein
MPRKGESISGCFKDSDVKRWLSNIERGSPLTAEVSLRRLGKACELLKLTPKDMITRALVILMIIILPSPSGLVNLPTPVKPFFTQASTTQEDQELKAFNSTLSTFISLRDKLYAPKGVEQPENKAEREIALQTIKTQIKQFLAKYPQSRYADEAAFLSARADEIFWGKEIWSSPQNQSKLLEIAEEYKKIAETYPTAQFEEWVNERLGFKWGSTTGDFSVLRRFYLVSPLEFYLAGNRSYAFRTSSAALRIAAFIYHSWFEQNEGDTQLEPLYVATLWEIWQKDPHSFLGGEALLEIAKKEFFAPPVGWRPVPAPNLTLAKEVLMTVISNFPPKSTLRLSAYYTLIDVPGLLSEEELDKMTQDLERIYGTDFDPLEAYGYSKMYGAFTRWAKSTISVSIVGDDFDNRTMETILKAFRYWEQASGNVLTFSFTNESPDITVHIGNGGGGVTYLNHNADIHSADIYIGKDDSQLYYVALHEIGHALGLAHSGHRSSIMATLYYNGNYTLTPVDLKVLRVAYGGEKLDSAIEILPVPKFVKVGQEIQLTAQVLLAVSTGNVTFEFSRDMKSWSTIPAMGTSPRYGRADLRWAPQEAGVFYIRARYSGNDNFEESISDTQMMIVEPATTPTALSPASVTQPSWFIYGVVAVVVVAAIGSVLFMKSKRSKSRA